MLELVLWALYTPEKHVNLLQLVKSVEVLTSFHELEKSLDVLEFFWEIQFDWDRQLMSLPIFEMSIRQRCEGNAFSMNMHSIYARK
ncbi:hypothetical protein DFQ30_010624 [Apophysomyces sp. BC1015]|nr:hypothetical protein DFQ30_010624 [Apophysomyces sp. BC1015]